MPKNLFVAHRQWATRPPDERFANLNDLLEYTGRRKRASIEDVRQLKGLWIYGKLQTSLLTNWAFTQLCQQAGVPDRYTILPAFRFWMNS